MEVEKSFLGLLLLTKSLVSLDLRELAKSLLMY